MSVYQTEPVELVQLDFDDLDTCEDRLYDLLAAYRERDRQIARERLLPALTIVRRLEVLICHGRLDPASATQIARSLEREIQGAIDRLSSGEELL